MPSITMYLTRRVLTLSSIVPIEHLDVLVVGAGLSGICAAYYLQTECPNHRYAIIESRDAIGGTWDLFRYPGIRSDSDMYTLGFSFFPWQSAKAIADGPAILSYINDTADHFDIRRHIRFGKRVIHASWSTEDSRWAVTIRNTADGSEETLTCNFLWGCTGYYNYAEGHTPQFDGLDTYEGELVHPQFWTDDIDYTGKRVIVIGSGATAITLVPELSHKADHVTMLQRSPTWIISRPYEDAVANLIKKILPDGTAHRVNRYKNTFLSLYLYYFSKKFPKAARKFFLDEVRKALGPDYPVEKHFNPTYNPWDQRLCLIPEDDLFNAIKAGKVTMATDHIDRFTKKGIVLKSGEELEADMVVTATGLKLQVLGGATAEIDGVAVNPGDTMMYKGAMLSDVPNFAMSLGYTNASWTLKCELISEYVCRLLNRMEATGQRSATPRRTSPVEERPLLDLNSNYIKRATSYIPTQGSRLPWKLYQNYLFDQFMLRYGNIEDRELEFS